VPDPRTEKLQVFYDGACPLCSREIAFYRRQQGAEHIAWSDVSGTSEREIVPGLSQDQALSRFHVAKPDGTLISGGAAFAELWAVLPAFRPIGRLHRHPFFLGMLNGAYELFLKLRPFFRSVIGKRPPVINKGLPLKLGRPDN
jgi:predicted DCC family thiol-disulfide oxidoreductase YuxK